MTVGHYECAAAVAPVVPAMPTDVNQPSEQEAWKLARGWSSFGSYDGAWAQALDRIAPKGRAPAGGRVAFLNVTEMSGQRVDAHALCALAVIRCSDQAKGRRIRRLPSCASQRQCVAYVAVDCTERARSGCKSDAR